MIKRLGLEILRVGVGARTTLVPGARGLILLVALFIPLSLKAELLSNVALYQRCYGHLTESRPDPSALRTQQVRSGQKSAIAACLEVLRSAQIGPDGRLVSKNPETLNVMRVFQNLHMSWFMIKELPDLAGGPSNIGNRGIVDASIPAYYFTRALFDPVVGIQSVVTGTSDLRALRSNQVADPNVFPPTGRNISEYIFNSMRFIPLGLLEGVQTQAMESWAYTINEASGSVNMFQHWGGGLLGSPAYLLQTVQESPFDFKSDGGLKMPRKWARDLYSDILCRSLPAVRRSDSDKFIVAGSSVPFRTSGACVSCHASMDRTASVIRNFRYLPLVGTSPKILGGLFPVQHTTNKPQASPGWPAESDADFAHRPTAGVLFLRNYKGDLVDLSVSGLAGLGAALADLDDFYICAAKRYYRYFTGIDAVIGDPEQTQDLTDFDKAQRDLVIELGLRLKSHKDPMRIIEDILSLADYRQSQFSVPVSKFRGLAHE